MTVAPDSLPALSLVADGVSRADVNALMPRVVHPNIIQWPPYIDGTFASKQRASRIYAIRTESGDVRGFFILQEITLLWRAVHLLFLDRGPMWLDTPASDAEQAAFWRAFHAQFPRRFLRYRRVLPELSDTPAHRALMEDAGFHQIGDPYQSAYLDITPSLDDIRARFKSKWRSTLAAAEKRKLEIHEDVPGASLDAFIASYLEDRMRKNYYGPSETFLTRIWRSARKEEGRAKGDGGMLIWALKDSVPIAGMLFFCHGNTATYQVAFTTDAGRDMSAHYVMMWDAIARLKARGISTIDMGGLAKDNDGLNAFKTGCGAKPYALCGIYR